MRAGATERDAADLAGYFDHNATTPLCRAAMEAWVEAQEGCWQNASSLYPAAARVRRRLEAARERMAELLGVEPERVVFTGGATEGNALIMRSLARLQAGTGGATRPVWISPLEHPAVRESALAHFGDERVEVVGLDAAGRVSVEGLVDALERGSREGRLPTAVSVIAAQNETGMVQPWQELAAICRERAVVFHTDASQWIGRRPLEGLGACDWVTWSAHKFGGPKGVGGILIPEGARRPLRLLPGGPQEGGHRAGTENFPGIAAMLAALEAGKARWADPATRDAARLARDRFEELVLDQVPGTQVVGGGSERMETVSMLMLPRHGQLKWLTRLAERGFAVSTGSACSAGRGDGSRALSAMGYAPEAMERVLRFSAGLETGTEAWERLADAVTAVWQDLELGGGGRRRVDFRAIERFVAQ